MRRFAILLAVTAAVSFMATGLAAASASRAKLELRKTSIGTILANGRGFTLYVFTKDGRNKDKCAGISGCPGIWPALTTSGKPIAGHGVRASLIGTIPFRGTLRHVTYAGHPLYLYSGDAGPGETSYVDFPEFGGNWPALNAAGHEVK